MKKLCILITISLILLTGCTKKVEENKSIDYGEKVYQVYTPYKSSISSYALDTDTVRYDTSSIDKILMDYSMDYYNPTDYYYQAGQYLDTDTLKNLLSTKKLNNKKATIDGNEVEHNYISYIYEQDYLNSNGEIKGMSIMLGLNRYHKVGSDIKELDTTEALNIGKAKANDLVSYIHSIDELKNINVVVGLYMLPSTTSTDGGSLEYIGNNDKNVVNFNKVSYGEYYVTTDYVKSNDNVTYQNFNTIVNFLKDAYSGLNISSKCTYKDSVLVKQIYTINTVYKNDNEIMAINKSFLEEYTKLFSKDIKAELIIKADGKVVSLLTKTGDTSNVHLIEGD